MIIEFDSITINSISGNAGVFTGSNIQLNWQSQTKENSAMGTVVGDFNYLTNNINVVYDNDVVDMPINNESGSGSGKSANEKGGT